MRPANRLACVAAALLLVSIAGVRALDIRDPRAVSDRAPLKVDRWVRGVCNVSLARLCLPSSERCSEVHYGFKYRSVVSMEVPCAGICAAVLL
jgi:hypothetical protein